MKPYEPSIDRAECSAVHLYRHHWLKSLGASGDFEWENEFNLDFYLSRAEKSARILVCCLKYFLIEMYVNEAEKLKWLSIYNGGKIMARTFNCNEEIIVVSEGTKDLGKLAMLACDGKFHPSVIPNQEKKAVMCRATKNGSQNIPNTAVVQIVFDGVDFDTSGMYDANMPTKLAIPSDGIYQLQGQVIFAPNGAGGIRTIGFLLNGADCPIGVQNTLANETNSVEISCGCIDQFRKNDVVELFAYQASGAALNVTSDDTTARIYMAIFKIGE